MEYLATLSADAPQNWSICKHHRLWGVRGTKGNGSAAGVEPGERVYIWKSAVGVIATARATEIPREPSGNVWDDGNTYSHVFGIEVEHELSKPIGDRFTGPGRSGVRTGIKNFWLQQGFVALPPEVASYLSVKVAERAMS